MLICDNYQFIFIHINKCAGTSVENAFRSKSFFTKNFFSAIQVRDFIGDFKWNSFFKFAIVRNPWDKMASLYRYRKNIKKIPSKMSFSKFIKTLDRVPKSDREKMKEFYRTRNQLHCCTDENENVIIDFIAKFENLKKDWKRICKKIGVNKQLPHVKTTKSKSKKHYRTYYGQETKKIVSERFQKDIEYFGYIF